MVTTIGIPDQLIPRIIEAARRKGFANAEDFLARVIEDKLLELE